jgi:CBS domain-containing protein
MPTKITAERIMTEAPFTLSEKTGVKQGAELLLAKGLSNAPVIRQDFTRELLVGFVSEKDFMQCFASGAIYTKPSLRVADVMRPHPICVKPEADLFTLAAIFMQQGFRHLPVVRAGVLQGMVSRRDVLRALVEHHRRWEKRKTGKRKPPDLAALMTQRYLVG